MKRSPCGVEFRDSGASYTPNHWPRTRPAEREDQGCCCLIRGGIVTAFDLHVTAVSLKKSLAEFNVVALDRSAEMPLIIMRPT